MKQNNIYFGLCRCKNVEKAVGIELTFLFPLNCRASRHLITGQQSLIVQKMENPFSWQCIGDEEKYQNAKS